MNNLELGYGEDLFVLPFDHRSSFEKGLLGISGRPADPQEVKQLAAYKEGATSRAGAVSRIADTYQRLYELFIGARAAAPA